MLVKVVFSSLQIGFWDAEQLSVVKQYQIFIKGNAVSMINLNHKPLYAKIYIKNCSKLLLNLQPLLIQLTLQKLFKNKTIS